MLVSGSRVQIREDGTTKPVEALQIGELVFDPLSGGYNEIIDILIRTVEFGPQDCVVSHSLYPVRVNAKYALLAEQEDEFLCSQGQEILVKKDDLMPTALTPAFASDIQRPQSASPVASVTYHAIFLATSRPLFVNGFLCMSFDPQIFQRPNSIPRRQAKVMSLVAVH